MVSSLGVPVLKVLGAGWVLSLALGAVYLFPLRSDIWGLGTGVLFAITVLVSILLARRRIALSVDIDNVYLVAGYLSLVSIVFTFCVMAIIAGYLLPFMGDLIYIIAIFGALVLVGVLNEDIPIYQLAFYEESSSILTVTRGLALGSIMYLIAYWLTGGLTIVEANQLMIGYLTTKLQVEELVGILFLMIFTVAIPEELLSRVFYFNVGSNVATAPLASLLMITTWYALHAVTRYFLSGGSLVLFIITLGGLVITVGYALYGFLCAVFTHAIYNTLIYATTYFGGVATAIAAVLIALNFLVARYLGVRAL